MKAKQILALSVLTLFFGLTFNAYACLVPVYAVNSMAKGCSAPEEEPVRQFCDTFKTLGPQSLLESSYFSTLQAVEWLGSIELTNLHECLFSPRGDLHRPIGNSPPDVLTKTSVLRI